MTDFSPIRRKRLAADLYQEALSGAARLHRTHVGLLERGIRMSSILVAKQVAKALGTTVGELLAEVDREEVDSPRASINPFPGRSLIPSAS